MVNCTINVDGSFVLKTDRSKTVPYGGVVSFVPSKEGGCRVVTCWKDGNGQAEVARICDDRPGHPRIASLDAAVTAAEKATKDIVHAQAKDKREMLGKAKYALLEGVLKSGDDELKDAVSVILAE